MAEDVKDSVIQKTQKTLGKHITKPTLTPKLLKKPPFRFLHDIVTSVIRETGFLKGLFTEHEMTSENVKERDAKVAFLTKLINAIATISGSELDVKPSKIVAGLEATKTNKLLQVLGSCLDKKLDSTEYVNKLNSGDKPEKKRSKRSDSVEKTTKNPKDSEPKDSHRKAEKASKSEKASKTTKIGGAESKVKVNKEKTSKTSIDSTGREDLNKKEVKGKTSKHSEKEKSRKKAGERDKNKDGTVENVKNPQISMKVKEDINKSNDVLTEDVKKGNLLEEPKEVSLENQDELELKEDEHSKVEQIKVGEQIKDGEQMKNEEKKDDQMKPREKINPEDVKINEQINTNREASAKVRPKSARIQPDNIQRESTFYLRPPSVRPPSARPGAPRLRPESALPTDQVIPLGNINVIVENCNTQDDEETVVIQNVELPQEQPSVEDVLNIPQDKGHLVEQILEQINDVDDLTRLNNEENLIFEAHSKDAMQKEVHQLQNLVQTLTKVANPLGKLMNYLHEDLDGMHSELIMWTNMKKQAYTEIKKQKEQQNNSNASLKQQLRDVEENIKKIESEITYVQANILRNDVRIKQLLSR